MLSSSWSATAKTARCVRMEQRVAHDPHDADAWVVLLGEAQTQAAIDFRPLFERCVAVFPSAASVWYQWLEAELRVRDLDAMEALFERCLLKCPHVELWRLYLRYQRTEKRADSKELQQTYELLLEAVGADVGAGPLWIEAVEIFKEAVDPGMMPTSGPVTQCRDAFQRCLVQPAIGLEALWKEYEVWEAQQSGPQAKAMLADIADRALVARRVARERKALVEPLRLNRMPRKPRGSAAEFAELKAWRAFWTYEGTNPQRLPAVQLQARMQFTFNQALMVLWFTPQVWHEAARWMQENGHTQAAHGFYTRALEVLPANEVLTLAYALLHEANGNAQPAKDLLEQLVNLKPSPLSYIHLMRLTRRSEGASAARAVFARARRAKGCTWQVYAAAAELEQQMSGSSGETLVLAAAREEEEDGGIIAARILTLALDRFEGEPAFILHTVAFLLSRNDANNARAVLERSLAWIECVRSKELWSAYIQLELAFGSPASVQAIEERRATHFPDLRVGSLFQLAAAHSYLGLWPASEHELRALSEEPPMTALFNASADGADGGAAGNAAGAVAGAGADGATADGAAVDPRSSAAGAAGGITVPILSLCTEYTGEPILLEPQATGAADSDAAMANVVPYQIDALLEAVPKRLIASALESPSSQDVQALFERLGQLPDKLADLPSPASTLPGGAPLGGWPQSGAVDVGAKRGRGGQGLIGGQRTADQFTARQRKKQQLGL